MGALGQTLITSGVVALLAVLVGRYLYVRFYLSKRLFFEPWVNLSRNESLNLGDGLAELLFFELESIRKLLEQAGTDSGLWNEKSALPALERSFEGYPEFVRHAELLGLPGRIAKLVRLVLLTKPQAIRGTIQQYGSAVRFQLALEGLRGPQGKLPVRCWTTSIESGKPESIPDAVAELAHSVVLDFGNVQGFKSSQTFRYFTSGLHQHLAYHRIRRPLFLEEAEKFYQLAIEHESGNAEASCNLGDLLYSQFKYETNQRAIDAYLGALKSDKLALRARAFRGLANAYCQRRQRHKRGGEAALEAALRWARFADELCRETSKLPREEQASIKKAEAYAQQVWAELGGLSKKEKLEAFQKAVDLYKEAIDLNERFTVAYNNVSYMYLKRAEEMLDQCPAAAERDRETLLTEATQFLKESEKWCNDAITTERTFHLAYDNNGNIAAATARAKTDASELHLASAVECYHRALSYQPSYREAHSDLAKAHSWLFRVCDGQNPSAAAADPRCTDDGFSRKQQHHASLAWQHHWDALTYTEDPISRRLACEDFYQVRSRHGLPQGDAVLDSDDVGRATKVNCACLTQEVPA